MSVQDGEGAALSVSLVGGMGKRPCVCDRGRTVCVYHIITGLCVRVKCGLIICPAMAGVSLDKCLVLIHLPYAFYMYSA